METAERAWHVTQHARSLSDEYQPLNPHKPDLLHEIRILTFLDSLVYCFTATINGIHRELLVKLHIIKYRSTYQAKNIKRQHLSQIREVRSQFLIPSIECCNCKLDGWRMEQDFTSHSTQKMPLRRDVLPSQFFGPVLKK